MNFELKEHTTLSGEILLYSGEPNFLMLEELVKGPGDIWHSSFEQGYKNAFPELVYQTAVFFWYLNDFDDLDECVSWRINPNQFAVRKSVWEITQGFDKDFENPQMQALDFGFRLLRFTGGVPLYKKNLFISNHREKILVSNKDRYTFFIKNFKKEHSLYMIYRLGFYKIAEWKAFLFAKNNFIQRDYNSNVPVRELKEISEIPTVSYIIPTMLRQDFTLQLLEDLSVQNVKPTQVIVVDATPESQRTEQIYFEKRFPFELIVIWQESKGSCRARNEAIGASSGDYIVFGDDDIRIPNDFIENHIRLLQTYNAGACNGLDIRADHANQDLNDLEVKLNKLGNKRWVSGCTQMFSNANSCVKRVFVNQLIGNDLNFDGGYGEDSDFGMSLSKIGVTVLHNPFSVNLHLKPITGGYRFWGKQAKITGKKRKSQPWELDFPVKSIRPVPSPTIMYGILKHYTPLQVLEYKRKHFLFYILNGSKWALLFRLLRIPYKNMQFKKSLFYAKNLLLLGKRTS